MEVIITQSQLLLLLEQTSNVYTDKALYDKALKIYNKKMEVYQLFLQLYKESDAWSKYFGGKKISPWDSPSMKKIKKLMKIDDWVPNLDWDYQLAPVIIFDTYYRCNNNLFEILRKLWPAFNKRDCNEFKKVYANVLGNLKVTKWENIKITCRDSYTKDVWIPIIEKPNIEKPIYRAPESVVNYKEIISNVTTFGTPYKTGTRAIELNIPGGPYYLTYPEFEAYKKTRPNTTFKKI